MRLKEFLLNEAALEGQKKSRGDFLVKTYASKWQGLDSYHELDEFIEKLSDLDPTKNGAYMQWLAKLAINKPDVNRTEDLERVASDLKSFEKYKSKMEVKDINAFKTYQDLYLAVQPFTVPRKKTADEKKADREEAKLAQIKGEVETVYTGKDGWIRIPTTKKAAQFLGQSTRWCTSAKANNMFDHYANSDSLFVVYDKQTKKRFQLHIQSGQFANEADTNEGMKAVPDWAWAPIIEWYKKNNPNLSMKHLAALGGHTEENLAAGTEHEEVMNLMKKYGVM